MRWLETGPTALDGAPAVLRAPLAEFLARFGHRGVSEAELAARPWADDPAPVLSSLLAFARRTTLARAAAADRRRADEDALCLRGRARGRRAAPAHPRGAGRRADAGAHQVAGGALRGADAGGRAEGGGAAGTRTGASSARTTSSISRSTSCGRPPREEPCRGPRSPGASAGMPGPPPRRRRGRSTSTRRRRLAWRTAPWPGSRSRRGSRRAPRACSWATRRPGSRRARSSSSPCSTPPTARSWPAPRARWRRWAACSRTARWSPASSASPAWWTCAAPPRASRRGRCVRVDGGTGRVESCARTAARRRDAAGRGARPRRVAGGGRALPSSRGPSRTRARACTSTRRIRPRGSPSWPPPASGAAGAARPCSRCPPAATSCSPSSSTARAACRTRSASGR